MSFQEDFNVKTVLITWYLRFEGSCLTAWLKLLKAKIIGVMLDSSTDPSNFFTS